MVSTSPPVAGRRQGAVALGVHLHEAARLEARRYEDHVGGGEDAMHERFAGGAHERGLARILRGRGFHLADEQGSPSPATTTIAPARTSFDTRRHEVAALLRDHAADVRDERTRAFELETELARRAVLHRSLLAASSASKRAAMAGSVAGFQVA